MRPKILDNFAQISTIHLPKISSSHCTHAYVLNTGPILMPVSRVITDLIQRRNDLRDWLRDEAPETENDQRHLEQHTPEQAYWHHGYQSALGDMLALITKAEVTCNRDKPSH